MRSDTGRCGMSRFVPCNPRRLSFPAVCVEAALRLTFQEEAEVGRGGDREAHHVPLLRSPVARTTVTGTGCRHRKTRTEMAWWPPPATSSRKEKENEEGEVPVISRGGKPNEEPRPHFQPLTTPSQASTHAHAYTLHTRVHTHPVKSRTFRILIFISLPECLQTIFQGQYFQKRHSTV